MSDNWIKAGSVSALEPGEIQAVEIAGEPVALYRLEDGRICATHNICTHEVACLSDGWIDGETVECPLHGGRFNLLTGAGMGAPVERPIAVYPVRVEGDDILVNAGTSPGTMP